MSDILIVSKINKKIKTTTNFKSNFIYLLNVFNDEYHKPENKKLSREFLFVAKYYGLMTPSLTLEAIGKSETPNITRERVRQIINHIVNSKLKPHKERLYNSTLELFANILKDKKFIRFEYLILHEEFSDYSKNPKGLIAFFNDCGIKQIAYRKKYYFYIEQLKERPQHRKDIIHLIQKENKVLRRDDTLKKMSHKSKTITYVPDNIRELLLQESEIKKINLTILYENIILDFIEKEPFSKLSYQFEKTQSWKARKGKADWQQIGIYINKDIFNKIKSCVIDWSKITSKNVSIMSFICQAFIWYYSKK